ncbi:MAG TPA: hypothetical protein VFL92_01405 [Sphingomonas sp.]|nr:hypothetical protein [Sphingomonas sp.]
MSDQYPGWVWQNGRWERDRNWRNDNNGRWDRNHDNRWNSDHDNGRWSSNNRWDRDHNDRNDWAWNGREHDWDPARHYHQGDYRGHRLSRNDRIYRGSDGRYYCRRSDGTTGLVIGAIGGGLLGGAIGGSTLGALIGAGGGALLGRAVDRGNVTCR